MQQKQARRASWFGALFVWALLTTNIVQARAGDTCAADHIDEWAEVAYIFDGDTIRLKDERIIRFIAINAPEVAHHQQPAEPLGEAAKQSLSHLLPVGSQVGLRYDRERFDSHHRVLAHIFDSKGNNISAVLLRQGKAFAIAIPPNLWGSTCYFGNETLARKAQRGVWAQANFQAKNADGLTTRRGGFYRVTGRVVRIGKSRRNVWLDMGKRFAVRITLKQFRYFEARQLESLQGKVITVRGWAHFYNGKLRLTLTHPAMLENIYE
jgi:micrococcal nuclease